MKIMLTVECVVNAHHLVDTGCQAEVHQEGWTEREEDQGHDDRWGTATPCNQGRTIHHKEVSKKEDGREDGRKTCLKCFASSAASTVISPICVPILLYPAIVVDWSVVLVAEQLVVGGDRTDTLHSHHRAMALASSGMDLLD